jgi:uncharacterized protein
MPTNRSDIDDFLACKRIAMVGVSRNPQDFSRALFRDLTRRGYDVVPVNPLAGEIEGKKTFPNLQDVDPPVEGALLMTSPPLTDRVVHDCAAANVRRVWMHRGGGQGAVSPKAAAFCREKGIRLVEGHCPFMFLPETLFFHRFHGYLLKMTGRYPRNNRAGLRVAS